MRLDLSTFFNTLSAFILLNSDLSQGHNAALTPIVRDQYYSQNGKGLPLELDQTRNDNDTVGVMTTLEPIDTDDINCGTFDSCEDCVGNNCTWILCMNIQAACTDAPDELCPALSYINCGTFDSCEDCVGNNCTWILCMNIQAACTDAPDELCPALSCSNGTTTTSPVTTDQPTTTNHSDTTTNHPTTAETTPTETTMYTTHETTQPITETTTSTSTSTTTNTTTTSSTSVAPLTTTTVEPTHDRHFDAASFVGGMILVATLVFTGYAGWKFYRKRSLATSYSNF